MQIKNNIVISLAIFLFIILNSCTDVKNLGVDISNEESIKDQTSMDNSEDFI